ncbi:MAG: alpha/beta hydrolase fold domain-containing protein [Lachnospiraceae bacterium]|nr:alpha/beta hydrolase fold domain-containing protein [Lachnospiraceae bacterium]
MTDILRLDPDNYTVRTCEVQGKTITFRAFEGLEYCRNPLDPIQKINLFIPEAYYRGESINGYTADTAPIFLPNAVGGYMPGHTEEPGADRRAGGPNSLFAALDHGYVTASAGIRGRTSGKPSNEFFEGSRPDLPDTAADGKGTGNSEKPSVPEMVGKAPALIVDYKAAIRWLRYNKNLFPGDTERIVTNGTSAGGALSALAGASADQPELEPYLREIGAAEESDAVFAASCYCPIHNLENADAAYEWLFNGLNDFRRFRMIRTENGMSRIDEEGHLTDEQILLSAALKAQFPAYVNSLALTDNEGAPLTLDKNGEGSFKEYVKSFVIASADKEFRTHDNEKNRRRLLVPGSEIDAQDYLTVKDGRVTGLDWDAFVRKITRMKGTPAFDALDLSSPENSEFGSRTIDARHFTAFSKAHSHVPGAELADPALVNLLNPVYYIRKGNAGTAKHWRIRHGSFDRDTALPIPVILAALLENNGCDVDFALPWGIPHSGDYDLEELFSWVDGLCR